MKIDFFGGFGEKGRTSLGLTSDNKAIILDVGVNTNDGHAEAPGKTYYPAIRPDQMTATDAILISHAHEDHIAAMGWCVAQGFRGDFYMTEETRRDMATCLASYAEPDHRAAAHAARIKIVDYKNTLELGPFRIQMGRSGHAVGGVWFHVSDGRRSLAYCGDIVPNSLVFAMDKIPSADLLVLDGSYANDPIEASARVSAIRQFARAHEHVLVPTPLSGKPLELLMAIDGPVATHASMRASLMDQVAQSSWLHAGAHAQLTQRLADAPDWNDDEPWPAGCLLAFDGMGMGGPSRRLLAQADSQSIPIMLTGHLPKGSLANSLFSQGRATWLRLPTHPVLSENLALVEALKASMVIAHSCDRVGLEAMQSSMPPCFRIVQTGESLEL